jgi:CheY-like chemotaxis protein
MKEMSQAYLTMMSPGLKQIRILYVDDCPGLLSLCKAAFEGRGYRVLTSSDCLDAVDILRREVVDLVVIDNDMPGICGNELAQVLREVNRNIVILMYSSIALVAQPTDVDVVVSKSDGPRALVEAVRRVASRLAAEVRPCSELQLPYHHADSYLYVAWKIIGGD